MGTFLTAHRVAIGFGLLLLVAAFIVLGLIQDWRSKRAQRYPDERRGRPGGGPRPPFPPHPRDDRDDRDASDSGTRRAPPRADPARDQRDDLRPDAAEWREAVRPQANLASRRTADDPEIRAELAKLTEQVGTLADRLSSGLERVDRRFEQLEMRVDGQTSSYGDASSYGREVDSMFAARPQYDPLAAYGAASDGVVSRPIGLGGGDAGSGGAGGGARIAVELNGTEVSASSTIPPDAWLTVGDGGTGDVSLDPDVHYHKFALDRFATFFDLGDRREGTYITRSPARVRWDEREQRGVLQTPGKAVVR